MRRLTFTSIILAATAALLMMSGCQKSSESEPYGEDYSPVGRSIRSAGRTQTSGTTGASTPTWIESTADDPTLGRTPPIKTAPAAQSNAETVTIAIEGEYFVQYQYGVVIGDGSCDDAAMSSWIKGTEPITYSDLGADGDRKVCIVGRDVYGHETFVVHSWTKDTEPPTIALADANAAAADEFAVTVSGDGLSHYKYAHVIDAASCGDETYSDWIEVSTPIADAFTTNGSQVLCVIGRDLAGNETVDAARYVRPYARLSGAPDVYSNDTALAVTVGGTDVAEYRYAFGSGAANCTSASFSSWRSLSLPITDATGADGLKHLCVEARSATGVTQYAPTSYEWTNDSQPPDPPTLSGTPSDPSNATSLGVTVSGSDVYSYQFAILTGAADCTAAVYGSWYAVSKKITAATGSDGSKRLCVRSRDRAENVQATVTEHAWELDATAPTATLSGGPAAGTTTLDASITVTVGPAGDAVDYKHALLSGTTQCSSATYPSTWTPVATAITESLGGDGIKTLCVVARDTLGNTQASATTLSWTKDTTPPTATLAGAPAALDNATALAVSVSDSDTSQYKYALTTAADCSGVTYSGYRAKATKITDALGADATYRLCVIGKDTVGNEQTTPTEYSWTKDTQAPAAGDLTLSNTPSSPAKVKVLAVTVNGADISKYKFKVGTDAATDCASATGYSSSEYDRTAQITASVSAIADGSVELCVWGRDAAGNYQALSDARSYVWTKDTVAPTASLVGLPTNPSSDIALNVTVSGENANDTYQHKVGETADVDCSSSAGYSAATSVATHITDGLTGLTDGSVTLCVVATDEAGNAQSYASATDYAWVKDNNPPTPGNSGTITASSVDLASLTLGWTKATDLVTAQAALKYKVYQSTSNNIDTLANMDSCESDASCSVIADWTANINSFAVTGLTSNTQYYFNVRVRDAIGRDEVYTVLAQRTPPAVHIAYRDATNSTIRYARTATTVNAFTIQVAESIATIEGIDLAIDANKKAHISYRSGNDVRYLTNSSGSWSSSLIQAGYAQSTTGIAVDSVGNVHASWYRFDSQKDWKHSYFNGTSWLATPNKIWNGNGSAIKGYHLSFVLDSADKVHAVAYDDSNDDLIYNTDAGGSWSNTNMTILDSGGGTADVGSYTSVARDGSNNIYVAYYDATNGDLRYAKKTGGTWAASELRESTNNVGQYTGIAVTPDNKVHIVFYDVTKGDLRYICHDGTSWRAGQIIDGATADVGKYASIVASLDNTVHVSYYDQTNMNLRYAKGSCGGTWTTVTIDSANDVGSWSAIAIDR